MSLSSSNPTQIGRLAGLPSLSLSDAVSRKASVVSDVLELKNLRLRAHYCEQLHHQIVVGALRPRRLSWLLSVFDT